MSPQTVNIKDIAIVIGVIASIAGASIGYGTQTESLKQVINRVEKTEVLQAKQWSEISEAKILNREQTIILQQISDNMRRLEHSLINKVDKR